MTMDDVLGGM